MIHVEMADSLTFCGLTIPPLGSAVTYTTALTLGVRTLTPVYASEWRDEPEVIQRATCEQCLLRIFMLGDSAAIALKRMGRVVSVVDVPVGVEPS